MTPITRICPVCNKPIIGHDYHIVPADEYRRYGEPILNLYPHQSCWRECWQDLKLYAKAVKA